ncbi:MAG TPA: alkaline phosphatase family protein [Bryobacteraceae bacterium]|nr:alkaline phosphatase family protein [Bryobacteraceae bacterium]
MSAAIMGPQLPARALTPIPHYDHVVIVMEENHSYSQILGTPVYPPLAFPPALWPYITFPLPITQDNYIRSLADQGASFTNSHALSHPSQPNYLDLFSGSDQHITTDGTPGHTFTAPSLGGELIASGQSFAGYSEDLPHTGYAGGDQGDWVRHHEPWVNFSDVPRADNLNLKKLPHDFTRLPTVSFVVPNNVDNMHSASVQDGDEWLHHHLRRYARWAKKHNSLLIVTWDESAGPDSSSNPVATVFYGAHIQRGQYNEHITHFNVLRTIEDMYGLAPTGAAATATPITDVFGG